MRIKIPTLIFLLFNIYSIPAISSSKCDSKGFSFSLFGKADCSYVNALSFLGLNGTDQFQLPASRTYLGDTTGTSGINAIARQEDGKIIAVGFALSKQTGRRVFAVARYLPNGKPDDSFGKYGFVTTAMELLRYAGDDIATSLVIQPDGKIVVGGYIAYFGSKHRIFAIARYLTNGDLDPDFGKNGIVTTVPVSGTGNMNTLTALALYNDGKMQYIVAAGFNWLATNFSSAIVVARYFSNGALDKRFGTLGIAMKKGEELRSWQSEECSSKGSFFKKKKCVVTNYDNGLTMYVNLAYSLLVLPNGNLLIGGGQLAQGRGSFYMLQLDSWGWPIQHTKGDAFAPVSYTKSSFLAPFFVALHRTQEGKILALGTVISNNIKERGYALFRYNANGTLDTSFGPNRAGYAVTSVGEDGGFAFGLVEQSDGKILLAGHAKVNGAYNIGLIRYSMEGVLDLTFGKDQIGIVTAPLPVPEALGVAAIADAHKKIIVAGQANYSNGESEFLIARFWE